MKAEMRTQVALKLQKQTVKTSNSTKVWTLRLQFHDFFYFLSHAIRNVNRPENVDHLNEWFMLLELGYYNVSYLTDLLSNCTHNSYWCNSGKYGDIFKSLFICGSLNKLVKLKSKIEAGIIINLVLRICLKNNCTDSKTYNIYNPLYCNKTQ